MSANDAKPAAAPAAPAAPGSSPAPATTRDAETISLQVKNQRGEAIFFKARRVTKLQKLMDAYCARTGTGANEVRFLFDGQRLTGAQTPHDLALEDEDVIDVVAEMKGGAGEGAGAKRKRETKFHYDGYMVDHEDDEDRQACAKQAEEAMLDDIVSALAIKRTLPDLCAFKEVEQDREFEAAVKAKRSSKEELNLVFALADEVRKRRLDFVAGKDNRAFNDE